MHYMHAWHALPRLQVGQLRAASLLPAPALPAAEVAGGGAAGQASAKRGAGVPLLSRVTSWETPVEALAAAVARFRVRRALCELHTYMP
jgi:hypothetical protein